MGLFGQNYNAEGPGVSKDAAEKRGFFAFFELYGRKFTSLVKVNLMYFVLILPTLLGFILTGSEYKTAGLILLLLGLLIFGPATAALTFIVRNLVLGKPVWMISDFKDQFKANFKQSLFLGILDILLPVVLYYSFRYYIGFGGLASFMAGAMVILASALFAMLNFYAYPMMVTFKLDVKYIIRNSMFFSIAKFPRNILILAIDTLILYAMLKINALVVIFGFAPFILFSTICFITVFGVWKPMADVMIPKKDDDDERVFSDGDEK